MDFEGMKVFPPNSDLRKTITFLSEATPKFMKVFSLSNLKYCKIVAVSFKIFRYLLVETFKHSYFPQLLLYIVAMLQPSSVCRQVRQLLLMSLVKERSFDANCTGRQIFHMLISHQLGAYQKGQFWLLSFGLVNSIWGVLHQTSP